MGLSDLPVHRLRDGIARGEIRPCDVVEATLDRIRRTEDLGAFLHVDPSLAREQAAKVAERIARGDRRGALLGIPVAVKDNICTAGMPTTCASKILQGWTPPYSATAVERLRDAGAILIGKTNLDEFSMGATGELSAVEPVRHPRREDHCAGGSSSGSAAAIASGAVRLALGSDTGGSARLPASFCGIVGLKPTYGSVSRFGLVAHASSLDVISPMAASGPEARLLFQVIRGRDDRDMTSRTPREQALQPSGSLPTVGRIRSFFETARPEVRHVCDQALSRLQGAGAPVREVELPDPETALVAYTLISAAEAATNLARYDGCRFAKRFPGADTVRATRDRGFGPEVKRRIRLGNFALRGGQRNEAYGRAHCARREWTATLAARLDDRGDVLACPVCPRTAPRLGELADPLDQIRLDMFTVAASLAGFPALSVPCGTTPGGLDVGLQLIGSPGGEEVLFRAADAIESAGRRP